MNSNAARELRPSCQVRFQKGDESNAFWSLAAPGDERYVFTIACSLRGSPRAIVTGTERRSASHNTPCAPNHDSFAPNGSDNNTTWPGEIIDAMSFTCIGHSSAGAGGFGGAAASTSGNGSAVASAFSPSFTSK